MAPSIGHVPCYSGWLHGGRFEHGMASRQWQPSHRHRGTYNVHIYVCLYVDIDIDVCVYVNIYVYIVVDS